jgi:hypothetical protein
MMKHGYLKAMLASVAAAGFLAGCATTVDWGGPLGHYRYSYDSRPVVYSNAPSGTDDTYVYHAPSTYTAPAVTYYHHDDDD